MPLSDARLRQAYADLIEPPDDPALLRLTGLLDAEYRSTELPSSLSTWVPAVPATGYQRSSGTGGGRATGRRLALGAARQSPPNAWIDPGWRRMGSRYVAGEASYRKGCPSGRVGDRPNVASTESGRTDQGGPTPPRRFSACRLSPGGESGLPARQCSPGVRSQLRPAHALRNH